MRVLSKINRGVILTVVVLLGVAAYLIGLEANHHAARREIRQVCEDYVAAELGYHMLPEAYRVEKPEMPGEELERYITAMKDELRGFYVDTEQTYRYKLEDLEANLTSQSKGEGVIYQFKKEITKYEIKFDGNTASVTLTGMTTYDGPADFGQVGMNPAARQNATGETSDRISLQRVDGEWKVTYAALFTPQSSGGHGNYRY